MTHCVSNWTHYRILLRVEKPEARGFYENETINSRWSTRELEIRKERLLIEQEKRLGASDDDV